MNVLGTRATLTNWSKSERSPCTVIHARDTHDILQAFDQAQRQGQTLIPHGAGHSYTDAALNTDGVVLDLTPMRRILAWDPASGVMRVEPGVTVRDVAALAWRDGWWPAVAPSTPDATIGGCAAMNVTGKNAWRCGCFGDSIQAVDVALATGDCVTVTPDRDAQFFRAVIGGLGLLGAITSVTLQLRRIASGHVTTHSRPAASFAEIFTIFAEEEATCDYLEAWIDGFATGQRLGRGCVSCATISEDGEWPRFRLVPSATNHSHASPMVRWAGAIGQPALTGSVRNANRVTYWGRRWLSSLPPKRQSLLAYTFFPQAAFTAYHALLPQGVETFQAYVPASAAAAVFGSTLSYAQKYGYMPIWCVLKRHRRDPFLLSYQVDGYSLELNFRRTAANAQGLAGMLRQMIAQVIGAGGRFYLAKDHFSTGQHYRASVGDAAVDAFLRLKRQVDPQTTLQSNVFRRIFQTTTI